MCNVSDVGRVQKSMLLKSFQLVSSDPLRDAKNGPGFQDFYGSSFPYP